MAVVDISNTYQLTNVGAHIDNTDVINSNRNLLDNPWFTVNQRNFTSSTGVNNIYSVDRWYIARGTGTISKTSNGITINGVGASRETTFQQMIDCGDLTGRTVTVSVNDGGTIRQITGTVPARTTSNNIFIRFTLRDGVSAFLYAMATSSAYAYMLQFQVNAGYTIDIRAVKLELGSYSTLANDVPPDYGEELAKCQQYFIRLKNSVLTIFGSGYASSATNLRVLIPLPVTMRATPTRSYSGSFVVMGNGSNSLAVTNMTVGSVSANGLEIGVTTSGMTLYQTYHLVSQDTTAYIDLSADL